MFKISRTSTLNPTATFLLTVVLHIFCNCVFFSKSISSYDYDVKNFVVFC